MPGRDGSGGGAVAVVLGNIGRAAGSEMLGTEKLRKVWQWSVDSASPFLRANGWR